MNWLAHFPALHQISDAGLVAELQQQTLLHAAKGSQLFHEGDACHTYLLLLHGSVRVTKTNADGHEILLYRLTEGQSCMLSTMCLLALRPYPAAAIAETDVDYVAFSAAFFERLWLASKPFRRDAMAYLSDRVCEMMMLIEDVAFARMDQRLARLLLARSDREGVLLHCTHQELAAELGTAREVLSRILKRFESQAWLGLRRGVIELKDRHGLEQVARS